MKILLNLLKGRGVENKEEGRVTLKNIIKGILYAVVQETMFGLAILSFFFWDKETSFFLLGAAIYLKVVQILVKESKTSVVIQIPNEYINGKRREEDVIMEDILNSFEEKGKNL